jgi:type IV pilus biogenesis protein CpaD/CtpE
MKSRLPLYLLGLSALGACASVPPPPADMRATPTAADVHRIEVTQTSERLEVPVTPADMALSSASRSQLRAFANNYLRYGHGALVP